MALSQSAPQFDTEHAPPDAPKNFSQPHHDIARLAQLHDEACETAQLANLLGRTPYAAGALAIGALAVVIFARGTILIAEPTMWLALVLIGAGAMARGYARAIRQPFERGILREFAYELNAIAIYMGFAWGAGAYLALGPRTSPLMLAAFAAAVPAIVAVTLRTREISLGLLVPIATLDAFAAVLRPLPEGPLTAAFVLIACAAVGGAIFWADRLSAPVPASANLSKTSLA